MSSFESIEHQIEVAQIVLGQIGIGPHVEQRDKPFNEGPARIAAWGTRARRGEG